MYNRFFQTIYFFVVLSIVLVLFCVFLFLLFLIYCLLFLFLEFVFFFVFCLFSLYDFVLWFLIMWNIQSWWFIYIRSIIARYTGYLSVISTFLGNPSKGEFLEDFHEFFVEIFLINYLIITIKLVIAWIMVNRSMSLPFSCKIFFIVMIYASNWISLCKCTWYMVDNL